MWNYVHTNELCHYGIKGQRWGVRRYQNPDGTLTSAGKRRVDRPQEVSRELATKSISDAKNIKQTSTGKKVAKGLLIATGIGAVAVTSAALGFDTGATAENNRWSKATADLVDFMDSFK